MSRTTYWYWKNNNPKKQWQLQLISSKKKAPKKFSKTLVKRLGLQAGHKKNRYLFFISHGELLNNILRKKHDKEAVGRSAFVFSLLSSWCHSYLQDNSYIISTYFGQRVWPWPYLSYKFDFGVCLSNWPTRMFRSVTQRFWVNARRTIVHRFGASIIFWHRLS